MTPATLAHRNPVPILRATWALERFTLRARPIRALKQPTSSASTTGLAGSSAIVKRSLVLLRRRNSERLTLVIHLDEGNDR